MGRGKRSIRSDRRKKNKGQHVQSTDGRGPRKLYEDIVRQNEEFEKFYKLQNICKEEEWSDFLSYLQKDLPTGFRITASKSEAKTLLKIIQGQYFKEFLNAKKDDGDVVDPICLPWYPDNLAWQLELTRKDIRRSEVFFKLHNFLISETASGSISRQEVVSMIPPIVLDIKPNHKILDMCAAPGSKTAQLIEYLHKGDDKLPTGFVVANDIDNTRCYMLVHQAKRLNSSNIIITNHDSSIMPNFTITNSDGNDCLVKFDRVLCDVPCTGDGTLRKNADIWQKWNAANGTNLHGVQFRIIKRGCEMLTVGGRLVYSTCSLNPLENEAVLHRLLLEAEGSLELVDVSNLLPGLKYNKGVSTWVPTTRDITSYQRFEDVPEKWRTVLRPQMFPPKPEDAEKFHLDRCIRILPHHQDTGAFFVAVLEKTKILPWESAKKLTTNTIDVGDSVECLPPEPSRKKRRMYGYKEDPYIFFENDDPIWKEIKEFYEIDDEIQGNCFLVRCKEGKKKNIYFTSPQVRDVVNRNTAKFKIINTGVKTFARCDAKDMKCNFRLAQEGLSSIYPFMGDKRKVSVTKQDLIIMLSNDNPKCPPETTKLSEESQKKIASIGPGSCVLVYEDQVEEGMHLELVGWIGAMSTRPYVPQCDCIHYLRLLGGDTTKFEVNKFKKETENEENDNKMEAEPEQKDLEVVCENIVEDNKVD